MLHRLILIFLVAVAFVPISSKADERWMFKRKPIQGEITRKGEHTIEVRSKKVIEESTSNVTFTKETKFKKGSDYVGEEDLREGDSVAVIGSKLPSGELVAREVLIGPEHENTEK